MLKDRIIAATLQLTLSEQVKKATVYTIDTTELTDEQVLEINAVFPDWSVGTSYTTGQIARYDGKLWRALQDSTGQEQYPPDAFVSGWKQVGEPDEHGIPWVQPLGATDVYNKGDKVSHNGKYWVSDIDNNVWEPGVYGWSGAKDDNQSEPEPDEPDIPEWKQPSGAQDAYKTGDKVTYNGKVYMSKIDGNVWAPDAYPQGWELVES